MTDPQPRHGSRGVPIVARLLDQIDADCGGDLEDYFGVGWREILGERLFDAWTDGYTTGFADSDNVLKEWKRRE